MSWQIYVIVFIAKYETVVHCGYPEVKKWLKKKKKALTCQENEDMQRDDNIIQDKSNVTNILGNMFGYYLNFKLTLLAV